MTTSLVETAAPPTTRNLLRCGVAAGPVFVGVTALHVLTREGFDLRRHPISLLSVGGLGWIQILTFAVSGVLVMAFAVGLRRALHPGRAGTFGPVLMGLFGLGLIAGGVFVADPALGFPPGTPDGIPQTMSWHAAVHGVAPIVAFNALIIVTCVFARRCAGERAWGWFAYSLATGLVCLGLALWPGIDGISVRLAVMVTLGFAWTTALAARLAQTGVTTLQ
jgi:hypothetical protein